ncbi:hypothetical protein OUZ56_028736 [Daphnia magna]|uniref:Uncharacterized protein n=1 Tax=Daphnia magna TaxID=35525 RepID=A0ABR0B4R6_9CRUS|nr:hypothetical protein OUZ56_028736 [Daphnia magna]
MNTPKLGTGGLLWKQCPRLNDDMAIEVDKNLSLCLAGQCAGALKGGVRVCAVVSRRRNREARMRMRSLIYEFLFLYRQNVKGERNASQNMENVLKKTNKTIDAGQIHESSENAGEGVNIKCMEEVGERDKIKHLAKTLFFIVNGFLFTRDGANKFEMLKIQLGLRETVSKGRDRHPLN